MDAPLSKLQKAPDYFAFFGLPPVYAVSEEQVDAAAGAVRATLDAASADAAASTTVAELRHRLDLATATLLDPFQRGEYLLGVFGSANDPNAVPPGFHDTLDGLQRLVASAVAAGDDERLLSVHEQLLEARQVHLDRVAEVFSFPRNVPNAVSQVARDLTICSELNAVRMVDQLLREV